MIGAVGYEPGGAGVDPYSDPHELFDVYTSDGRPTGKTKRRADVHRDGDWHRSFHCWVTCLAPPAAGRSIEAVGPGGPQPVDDDPWLILQRRGLHKDTWPGRLDASVGGHYRAGETLAEVVREVEEEIGRPAPLAHLRSLGQRVSVSEPAGVGRDRELQDVFLWRTALPLDAFRPQPVEVLALEAAPLSELLKLCSKEVPRIAVVALSPDGVMVDGEIALADFIPTVDSYFYRVAVAVDLARRGYAHTVV